MSDTTNHATTTPPTTPEPTPTPTGMAAIAYEYLPAPDEAVSAAELALAAKMGHSTAGKVLNTLEKLNLAVRIRGTYDGHHRSPDLWHRAPTTEEPSESLTIATPTETQPPASPSSPDPDVTPLHSDETVGASQDAQPQPEPHNAPAGLGADGAASEVSRSEAPADESDSGLGQPAGQRVPAPQVTGQPGANGRLAPGGLRQMVIDHLQAHPGEAFTATKISRVIERSSGAIANALVTLTNQGLAERVSEKPLTYRLATTGPATQ
ncbi:hypothetical protein [Actinacidiphila yeochonensis]|uniref:hypothetical protein n=1 Tax=Actinacidiphila yeochonensis TaxID=89050 RepID=UPI00056C1AD2|nr:hypothetical protein [Actinacidiphila yeochonensis]